MYDYAVHICRCNNYLCIRKITPHGNVPLHVGWDRHDCTDATLQFSVGSTNGYLKKSVLSRSLCELLFTNRIICWMCYRRPIMPCACATLYSTLKPVLRVGHVSLLCHCEYATLASMPIPHLASRPDSIYRKIYNVSHLLCNCVTYIFIVTVMIEHMIRTGFYTVTSWLSPSKK